MLRIIEFLKNMIWFWKHYKKLLFFSFSFSSSGGPLSYYYGYYYYFYYRVLSHGACLPSHSSATTTKTTFQSHLVLLFLLLPIIKFCVFSVLITHETVFIIRRVKQKAALFTDSTGVQEALLLIIRSGCFLFIRFTAINASFFVNKIPNGMRGFMGQRIEGVLRIA